ncbi:MAG: hypothetical protein JNL12_12225 [Planctomycetes bacterium]|nr:hypothetical protein [Planctomycetota bacterium]
MLLKSLRFLIAAVLLTLAAIVAYALLRLSGPDQAMRLADQFVQQRNYAEALRELDLAERSVANDPMRLEALRRRRYAVNTLLGNTAGALRDLDDLLASSRDDLELKLDRVRLQALAGDGTGARLAAQQLLVDHGDNGRALELAGEACQTVYQPRLRELRQKLDRELPLADRTKARAALLQYLYRQGGDPGIAQALADLQKMHEDEPRRRAAWENTQLECQGLRKDVQEALDYFRRSLEADGKPVAGFRAIAWALEQAGRLDDLEFTCEVQRVRFRHEYVAEAGATAVWSLLRSGLVDAAITTGRRFWPEGTAAQYLRDGWPLEPATALLLARGFAAFAQRNLDESLAVWRETNEIFKVDPRSCAMTMPVVAGLVNLLARPKDGRPNEGIENAVRWATNTVLQRPPLFDWLDLADTFVPEMLTLRTAAKGDFPAGYAILEDWSRARPDALAPQLARARHLAADDRLVPALSVLDQARVLAADDSDWIDLRVTIARQRFQEGDGSGAALLAQCQRRSTLVPEVADPVGYLLCAEAATELQVWPVAIASSRQAVDAMPRSAEARAVEIRAHLGAGRMADAARLARRLLEQLPPTQAAVELVLATHRKANVSCTDLLHTMMASVPPNEALQAELLRTALAAADPGQAVLFATPFALQAERPLLLRTAAIRALLRAGQVDPASVALRQAVAEASTADANARAELAIALVDWAVAARRHLDDGGVVTTLRLGIEKVGGFPPETAMAMWDAAGALAPSHPRSAWLLLDTALPVLPSTARGFPLFHLAGRLAAATGAYRLAEEHWTAALAFPASDLVAEDLARLYLGRGQRDRARAVANLVANPNDPALAVLVDRKDDAAATLTRRLAEDRGDLVAHAMLAMLGQPSFADWRPDPVQTQDRLEALALAVAPELAPLLLEVASRLVAAEGSNPTAITGLLQARALLHTGRPEAAAAAHATLFAANRGSLLLWREVALASERPGYVVPKAIQQHLATLVQDPDVGASPPSRILAASCVAKELAATLPPEAAELVQLQALAFAPPRRSSTPAERDLFERHLLPRDAFELLQKERTMPFAVDPDDLLQRAWRVAGKAIAADPTCAASFTALAESQLRELGPRGELVHFLLEHDPARTAAPVRADLLRQSLQRIARGDEPPVWLRRTVQALVAGIGRDATELELTTALHRYPTNLPLWVERARLAVDSGTPTAAVLDLRKALQHGSALTLQLEQILLAAEGRTLAATDRATFAALPEAMRTSPDGVHAEAMVKLRSGDAAGALTALDRSCPRPDGMHLFARALAELQNGGDDATARAVDALQQLLRDYPSSSVARNAGSFVRQLSPR